MLLQCNLEALKVLYAGVCVASKTCNDVIDGATQLELIVKQVDALLDLIDDLGVVC